LTDSLKTSLESRRTQAAGIILGGETVSPDSRRNGLTEPRRPRFLGHGSALILRAAKFLLAGEAFPHPAQAFLRAGWHGQGERLAVDAQMTQLALSTYLRDFNAMRGKEFHDFLIAGVATHDGMMPANTT